MSHRPARWILIISAALAAAAAGVLCGLLSRVPVDVAVDMAAPSLEPPSLIGSNADAVEMQRVPDRFVPSALSFTLVATGVPNASALGSEVKIFNLPSKGRIAVDPPGSWQNMGDGLWVSHRVQPATLTWSGEALRLPVLKLVHNPWSGRARLVTSSGEFTLDLYAPEEQKGIVDYPLPAGAERYRYHAQVPRKLASELYFSFGYDYIEFDLGRVYIGALWPIVRTGSRAYAVDAVPTWWVAGIPEWQRGGLPSFLLFFVVLASLLYALGYLFLGVVAWSRQPLPDRTLAPFPWRMFSLFFGALMLEYLLAWLAFFPAALSSDSLWTWEMTRMMKFNDNHPAFHAMTLKFFTLFWDSPGAIVPAQMLLFASVQAYGFSLLLRAGVRRSVVFVAFALSLLSLRNAMSVAVVWKDIPFTPLFALAVLLSLQLLLSGRSRAKIWLWAVLGLALGLLPLYRHNGLVLLALYPVLLLLFFHRDWPRVLVACLVAFAVFATVKVGVYGYYRVAPMDNRTWGLFYSWQIAALLDRPVVLAPEEYEFLDGVRPFAERAWDYTPDRPMETIYNPHHQFDFVASHGPEYTALYRSLLGRYFLVFVYQRLSTTAYLWWPLPYRSPMLKGGTYASGIEENSFGLRSRPVLPLLQQALSFLAYQSFRTPLLHDLWRPAWHLWAVTLAWAVLTWRTRRAYWLVLAAPLWVNTLVIILLTHSPEGRYQLPLTFLCGTLVALAWLPREAHAETQRPRRG